MSIYKACDIRGDAATELSADLYRRWGRSLGCRLEPGAPFLVGGDVRPSTAAFLNALAEGLREAGVRVLEMGVAPTPMVYFARRHLGVPACAIVTASHNPAPVNGLKWMVGPLPPDEAEVASLREAESSPEGADRPAGTRRPLEVRHDYAAWLSRRWRRRYAHPIPAVVLDPGGGCWSGRARGFLESAFSGIRVAAIHDRPDGRFAERNPDCARPAHLTALAGAVPREKAGLGIAFDGDGDRVAFVDDEGRVLTAEEVTFLLLASLGEELRGGVFVHDVKLSDRVVEAARERGARTVPQRSGHAFIRRSMIREDARFGAEISGHYFYGEMEGGDDGLDTSCRLVARLAGSGRRLSELRRACPPVFMTPDLRVAVEPSDQEALLGRIREAFRDRPLSFVDGVRVDFEDGWALARRSVTEARLTFRFEGRDAGSLNRVARAFCASLPGLGPRILGQLESP